MRIINLIFLFIFLKIPFLEGSSEDLVSEDQPNKINSLTEFPEEIIKRILETYLKGVGNITDYHEKKGKGIRK